jgi:cytochrome b involved in lipid metabolism
MDDNPNLRHAASDDTGDGTVTKTYRSKSTDLIDANGDSTQSKIDWRDLPFDMKRNIICNSDGSLYKIIPSTLCDACPYCNDTCQLDDCAPCALKRKTCINDGTYTICQTRRNRNLACCWVVVDTTIYDATANLEKHPGGVTSILRYSGGVNCSEHLYFHSVRGKKRWKELTLGKLVYCDGGKDDPNSPPPSVFGKSKCSIS